MESRNDFSAAAARRCVAMPLRSASAVGIVALSIGFAALFEGDGTVSLEPVATEAVPALTFEPAASVAAGAPADAAATGATIDLPEDAPRAAPFMGEPGVY